MLTYPQFRSFLRTGEQQAAVAKDAAEKAEWMGEETSLLRS